MRRVAEEMSRSNWEYLPNLPLDSLYLANQKSVLVRSTKVTQGHTPSTDYKKEMKAFNGLSMNFICVPMPVRELA
ncbi:MAG: hypothetical protein AAF438_08385 [Pseudomonadota bacterium]